MVISRDLWQIIGMTFATSNWIQIELDDFGTSIQIRITTFSISHKARSAKIVCHGNKRELRLVYLPLDVHWTKSEYQYVQSNIQRRRKRCTMQTVGSNRFCIHQIPLSHNYHLPKGRIKIPTAIIDKSQLPKHRGNSHRHFPVRCGTICGWPSDIQVHEAVQLLSGSISA